MTGIGENTLAQPVKPPLRERCACLAKLVKNRLTLTEFFHGRDWSGWSPGEFIEALGAWIGCFNSERASDALGGATPDDYRSSLGMAAI